MTILKQLTQQYIIITDALFSMATRPRLMNPDDVQDLLESMTSLTYKITQYLTNYSVVPTGKQYSIKNNSNENYIKILPVTDKKTLRQYSTRECKFEKATLFNNIDDAISILDTINGYIFRDYIEKEIIEYQNRI